MRRTTISLPDPLWSLVESEARRRGTSASALIREAIDEWLGSDGGAAEEPAFVGMFDAPAMTPAAMVDSVIAAELADAISRNR